MCVEDKEDVDKTHSILAGTSVVQETEVCLTCLVATVNLSCFRLAPVCSNKDNVSHYYRFTEYKCDTGNRVVSDSLQPSVHPASG